MYSTYSEIPVSLVSQWVYRIYAPGYSPFIIDSSYERFAAKWNDVPYDSGKSCPTQQQVIDGVNAMVASNALTEVSRQVDMALVAMSEAPLTVTLQTGAIVTFQMDPTSQDEIKSAIPIFDSLQAAAIAAGLPSMVWRMANNSMSPVTVVDLQNAYNIGGARRLGLRLRSFAAKDQLKAGVQLSPAELAFWGITING